MDRRGSVPARRLIRKSVMVATLVIAALLPSAASAAFPGSNGPIVFGKLNPGTIFAVDSGGGRMHKLGRGYFPDVSPDGRSLVYVGDYFSGPLMTKDLRSGKTSEVGDLEVALPAWSPTGNQLAFTRFDAGVGIWVVNRDGSGAHQVVRSGGAENPVWSPAGDQIVYTRRRELYSVDLRTLKTRRLTFTKRAGVDAADFSPHGRWVVYSVRGQIERVSSDGGHQRVLRRSTSARADSLRIPVYSPNGQRIAMFARDDNFPNFHARLAVMRSNGSHLRFVTGDLGSAGNYDFQIDWAPKPAG